MLAVLQASMLSTQRQVEGLTLSPFEPSYLFQPSSTVKTCWSLLNGFLSPGTAAFLSQDYGTAGLLARSYLPCIKTSPALTDLCRPWYILHLIGMMAVRLIHLRHEDVRGDSIHFSTRGRFSARVVHLTPPLRALIACRRRDFPKDVWVIQSHSARVRGL